MMTNENERRQPGRFRRMMSRMGFGRPEYPASYDPAAAPPAPAAGPGPAAQGPAGRPGTQPGAAPQPGVEPAPQQQGAAHPGAQQPAPEAPAAYGYARPQPPPAHAPASAPPAPGHQPQQRGGIALAAPAQQQGLHRAEPRKEQPVLLGDVVAGMAMRDLNLVDALLATVEDMEDGADDPALLDRLFEIDNLATRMRRHSENLLVLTGQSPVDPDEEPVPVLDVARAAISEIKDYARIQVGRLPNGYVLGTVADDVSHLLAELLDNATEHSPEHAQVVISAQPTADGGLLYIVEDEGIGIPREEIEDLNSRLAGPPRMDQRSLRHMGLYVASVIADRHGLTVQLEARAFRGVSAYAVVPKELLSDRGPRPDQGRGLIRTAPPSNARSGGDDIAPPRGGRPDGGRAPLAGQPGT
ncbi:sensor histidine kinase, partial [Nocardiopsis coralliicola]